MSDQQIDYIQCEKDFSTNSNYENFDIPQINIEWEVDFEQKVISGNVVHNVQVLFLSLSHMLNKYLFFRLI